MSAQTAQLKQLLLDTFHQHNWDGIPIPVDADSFIDALLPILSDHALAVINADRHKFDEDLRAHLRDHP